MIKNGDKHTKKDKSAPFRHRTHKTIEEQLLAKESEREGMGDSDANQFVWDTESRAAHEWDAPCQTPLRNHQWQKENLEGRSGTGGITEMVPGSDREKSNFKSSKRII